MHKHVTCLWMTYRKAKGHSTCLSRKYIGGMDFLQLAPPQPLSSHGFSASMKGKTTSGIKGPADGAFSTAEALYGKLSDSVTVKCKKKKITKTVLFVFPSLLHLSDAFIQSNLQCIQAIHLYFQYVYSLGIEPTTFALLMQCSNHWATGTTGTTY